MVAHCQKHTCIEAHKIILKYIMVNKEKFFKSILTWYDSQRKSNDTQLMIFNNDMTYIVSILNISTK